MLDNFVMTADPKGTEKMSAEQELKPCPWCGKIPHRSFSDPEASVCCINGKCLSLQGVSLNTEMWNSANCWKELDEARAEIMELKKILSVSDEGYRKLITELAAKDKELAELRAAREGAT